MHDMQTIATNVPVVWCVCQPVCHVHVPAEMAERVNIMFLVETLGGELSNEVLNGLILHTNVM